MPHIRFVLLPLAILAVAILPAAGADKKTKDSPLAKVRVVKDIAYLGEDRNEKLDLYLPDTTGDDLRPAVVIIHGGGWTGGDKAAGREKNIGHTLAANGYVCISINYLLAAKSDSMPDRLRDAWPQNLQDCQTAVRYLRAHAEKYRIDPDHIGAIGGSAGGHLVAALATVDAEDGFDQPRGLYGKFSSRIQAVVPMYGVHDILARARSDEQFKSMTDDDRKLCQSASPVTYIDAEDPPALILHGTSDAVVPIEQSQILYDRLRAAKVPAELLIVKDAVHSFHLEPPQQDLRPAVLKFFADNLKPSAK